MTNSQTTWKPNSKNARSVDGIAVLYGGVEGGTLAEHSHPELQVSIHFHGFGLNKLAGSHVNVFASQQPHVGGWKKGDEIVVIQLPVSLIIEIRDQLSIGSSFDVIPGYHLHDPVLEGLGQFVRNEYQNPAGLDDLLIESVGLIAARHLLRVHASNRVPEIRVEGLSAAELMKVQDYISGNLNSGFSVGQMAAVIGVGTGKFAERLKASTGQSPWRFVQLHKLKLAKRMLHTDRAPIAQIADELGFTDQSHFTNFFRANTGITPRAYRAKIG